MTNGAFQSSQSSLYSLYNEKHGHKLILEVRREGTIDEEAISVLSVLRGVIIEASPPSISGFFLYSLFCLEFGRRATCQWCRDIGPSGPPGRSTVTGGGNVCEVEVRIGVSGATFGRHGQSSEAGKSRPSQYNREASKKLLFKVFIHLVNEAGWHAAGIANKYFGHEARQLKVDIAS